jgi:hypothetical protein
MSTVRDLLPGDIVTLPGSEVSGVFITADHHATYPGLKLVVWKLSDGTFSFDALNLDQHIGQIQPAGPEQRQEQLRRALES